MKTSIEPIEPTYTQYRSNGDAVALPSKSYADGYRYRVRMFENDPKDFIQMRFCKTLEQAEAFAATINEAQS